MLTCLLKCGLGESGPADPSALCPLSTPDSLPTRIFWVGNGDIQLFSFFLYLLAGILL